MKKQDNAVCEDFHMRFNCRLLFCGNSKMYHLICRSIRLERDDSTAHRKCMAVSRRARTNIKFRNETENSIQVKNRKRESKLNAHSIFLCIEKQQQQQKSYDDMLIHWNTSRCSIKTFINVFGVRFLPWIFFFLQQHLQLLSCFPVPSLWLQYDFIFSCRFLSVSFLHTHSKPCSCTLCLVSLSLFSKQFFPVLIFKSLFVYIKICISFFLSCVSVDVVVFNFNVFIYSILLSAHFYIPQQFL